MEIGDALVRRDPPVDDGAGEDRLVSTDELLPEHRADSVGRDDDVGKDALTALEYDDDLLAGLVDADDAGAESQHTTRQCVDEHPVQVRAEDVELRRTEVLLRRSSVLDMEQHRGIVPTQKDHRVGPHADPT